MLWSAFGQQWLDNDKISFDGDNKLIVVHEGVVNLNIRADVWSAWVRWQERYSDEIFLLAMRRTGLESTPSGPTGDFYFLTNGWKLVVDFSKVRITGTLFSDDFETAYYTPTNIQPQFAATVSTQVSVVETASVSATVSQDAINLIVDGIFAKQLQGAETFEDALAAIRTSSTLTTSEISAQVWVDKPLDLTAQAISNQVWADDTTGLDLTAISNRVWADIPTNLSGLSQVTASDISTQVWIDRPLDLNAATFSTEFWGDTPLNLAGLSQVSAADVSAQVWVDTPANLAGLTQVSATDISAQVWLDTPNYLSGLTVEGISIQVWSDKPLDLTATAISTEVWSATPTNLANVVPITTTDITEAVWDAPMTGNVTSGTFGAYVQQKILTVGRFLGLQ
jgi:hypothetical protein